MRVRFFNTYEPVSPVYRDLLPYLARLGWSPEVVMARQEYRPGQWDSQDPDIRVRHIPTALPKRWASLAKAWTPFAYAVGAALTSLLAPQTDVNVFLTQPPLFSLWGRVLRAARRQPYCCVIMDLYPWFAVRAGVLRPGSFLTRLLERVAIGTLTNAEAVFVIGRCMAERVAALGVAADRIHLIWNWANTDVIRPLEPDLNPMRAEQGFEGKTVVMYSGNLGESHYFDDILLVAERLRQRKEIVFLFVGRGRRLEEVRAAARDRSLTNIRFLDYQDYSRLGESLSMGDIHFVSLRNGYEGLVVPSKAYGIMAAGRPIIYQGSRRGEIARLIEEHEVGTVVPEGDFDGLFKAVVHACSDEAWRRRAGTRSRQISAGVCGAAGVFETCTSVLGAIGRPGASRGRA